MRGLKHMIAFGYFDTSELGGPWIQLEFQRAMEFKTVRQVYIGSMGVYFEILSIWEGWTTPKYGMVLT